MYRPSEKKLVKQQYLLYMSPQYGELGPLAAEIVSLVWGTPANFNGFRVLLWSPYVIGQTIIFMAALCNRGAIIFLPCSFFLSSIYLLLSFFPRLISVKYFC